MNRSYFVWIFHSKSPIDDKRVVREDVNGYLLQTRFQRSVGVRYLGKSAPRFPDSWGGFTGNGPRAKPRHPRDFLRGFFGPGFLPRHRVLLFPGAQAAMSKYRGNAVLYAKHLRPVRVAGVAVCVGRLCVRVGNEA